MLKSRAEEVFDHTIQRVILFSTTLEHSWAIVPTGWSVSQAWPVHSRRFRERIAHSFFTKHLLYPGRHSLESAITLLGAIARHGGAPKGEIFTRLGHTGNPHRPIRSCFTSPTKTTSSSKSLEKAAPQSP